MLFLVDIHTSSYLFPALNQNPFQYCCQPVKLSLAAHAPEVEEASLLTTQHCLLFLHRWQNFIKWLNRASSDLLCDSPVGEYCSFLFVSKPSWVLFHSSQKYSVKKRQD